MNSFKKSAHRAFHWRWRTETELGESYSRITHQFNRINVNLICFACLVRTTTTTRSQVSAAVNSLTMDTIKHDSTIAKDTTVRSTIGITTSAIVNTTNAGRSMWNTWRWLVLDFRGEKKAGLVRKSMLSSDSVLFVSFCLHNLGINFSVFYAQHHFDPGRNLIKCTSTISSCPRFLHQLVHYFELSHIIGDEHHLDNYQLYLDVHQRYSSQSIIGDHNIDWISDSHSNLKFWSLSTETNRDHAGRTTVDIHSFSLRQNQSIGYHRESHSTRHIDSYQRSTQGSAPESRQLLGGSRYRPIQRECEYFSGVSWGDLSISLGLDVRLFLPALRIVSTS